MLPSLLVSSVYLFFAWAVCHLQVVPKHLTINGKTVIPSRVRLTRHLGSYAEMYNPGTHLTEESLFSISF